MTVLGEDLGTIYLSGRIHLTDITKNYKTYQNLSLEENTNGDESNTPDVTGPMLKFRIAHGLSMWSSMPHCFIVLRDPDLSNQRRNEVWKKIIERWRNEQYESDHKSIDISHLKARDENERKHGIFVLKHRKEPDKTH